MLGAVLGLLGIAAAILLTLATGVVGGSIALLLGLTALILGFRTRGVHRGIGAIVTGFLAMMLSVLLTVSFISMFTTLHHKAETKGTAPLVAEYANEPYLGLMGIIMRVPSEADAQAFTDQVRLLLDSQPTAS